MDKLIDSTKILFDFDKLNKKGNRRIVFGLLWFFSGWTLYLVQTASPDPGDKPLLGLVAVFIGIFLLIAGLVDKSKAKGLFYEYLKKREEDKIQE